MTFDLGKIMTDSLISGLNNGSFTVDYVTYNSAVQLSRAIITQDEFNSIQTAITAYQANQAELAKEASELASETGSESDNDSSSESTSESTSEAASESESTSDSSVSSGSTSNSESTSA